METDSDPRAAGSEGLAGSVGELSSRADGIVEHELASSGSSLSVSLIEVD